MLFLNTSRMNYLSGSQELEKLKLREPGLSRLAAQEHGFRSLRRAEHEHASSALLDNLVWFLGFH